MKAIADTGFVVAFANRTDRHHDWALRIARQAFEPFLTCDAVLAESSFHLQSPGLVLNLIKTGLLRPAFELADHLERLARLAVRYADRKPDLADLCVIRLSELFPAYGVITVDVADFRIYRRNGRETIPLITPPDMN